MATSVSLPSVLRGMCVCEWITTSLSAVGVVRWPFAGETAGYKQRWPNLTPVFLKISMGLPRNRECRAPAVKCMSLVGIESCRYVVIML